MEAFEVENNKYMLTICWGYWFVTYKFDYDNIHSFDIIVYMLPCFMDLIEFLQNISNVTVSEGSVNVDRKLVVFRSRCM